MRGKHAESPAGCIRVNVTSAQATLNKNRRDFSPMTPVVGGYKGFWNFEHYWQSGKVIDGLNHVKTTAWWKAQTAPHRRYPKSKGMKVLYATWDGKEKMDYVTSRKKYMYPSITIL